MHGMYNMKETQYNFTSHHEPAALSSRYQPLVDLHLITCSSTNQRYYTSTIYVLRKRCVAESCWYGGKSW